MTSKLPALARMACMFACAVASMALHAETLKVAFIDPFTGPYGAVSQNALHSFQVAEEIAQKENRGGGVNIEFVPFDNKISAQESLSLLKSAIDQGYRYVMQGVTSGITAALVDAIQKHNDRNPGKEVVLLNWLSTDPDATNKDCNFWHFRFYVHSDILAEGLTTVIARDKTVKKFYLIDSGTSSGRQVSRGLQEALLRKRPDIQIVGDDFYPLGQVKDFTPYVQKIIASGADTVFAGNGSVETGLFAKAAKDANLQASIYSYYANGLGAAAAIGASGVDRLKLITFWQPNVDNFAGVRYVEAQRKAFDEDYVVVMTQYIVEMLHAAAAKAGTLDPVKLAFAMEGLKVPTMTGDVEMRKSDHQAQIPLYIGTWAKVDGKTVRYEQEKSGYGWRPDVKLEPAAASLPTTCQMKRPG
jgi:branched-chain amino acid transport system substrate-binding protein